MAINDSSSDKPNTPLSQKPSGIFWNLFFNLIVPMIILTKFSGADTLGIKLGLITALSFPIVYGLKDFISTNKINLFSVLGVISVPLTGGISLLELDAIYIAIKEAAIPGILGAAILISLKTTQPFIHTLLKNRSIVNTVKISQALDDKLCHAEYDHLLTNATWFLAGSFFLSSTLNFFLAIIILTAEPGTELFNQQLGRMLALSLPVNALPAMLVNIANLVYVSRGIKRLTSLTLEEILIIDTENAK